MVSAPFGRRPASAVMGLPPSRDEPLTAAGVPVDHTVPTLLIRRQAGRGPAGRPVEDTATPLRDLP